MIAAWAVVDCHIYDLQSCYNINFTKLDHV